MCGGSSETMRLGNVRWQIPIWGLLALLLTVDGFAKSADEWYREGVELSFDGAPDRAVHAFLQALGIKPEWAEAHHALGVQYFNIDSGLQGITHLRKAARYYRKRLDFQARKNLAIVENNLDKAYVRLNVAPKDFDAIELDPGFTADTQWQAVGIGFLIGNQGFLLTPNHNLADAKNIRVRFNDGKQSPAKLVKSFVVYDVAILQLEDAAAVPQTQLSFGNAFHLRNGDPVYLIDLETEGARMVQGPILEVNALENNTNLFHVGLPLKTGHSGGPLLNPLGKVVGMAFSQQDIETNFARAKDVPKDTSFALKSSYLQTIASHIIKLEKVNPGPGPHLSGGTPSLATKFNLRAVADNVVSIETSRTP